jgi:twinkle protein
VDYPSDCKDLNDVLLKHGHDKVREVISNAKPYPLDGVFTAKDLWNQVVDVYKNGYPEATYIDIGEMYDYVKYRTKRLYLFTGIPNHGKSVFVDFVSVKLMLQGWKSMIYSPETERVEHISRQVEQLTGKSFFQKTLTMQMMDEARDFLSENCYYLLTEDRNLNIDEIIDAATTYVMRFGVKVLIIDPFNTVEYDLKDYSGDMNKYIGSVLDRLKYFAKKYDVLVAVVAHPHKMPIVQTGDFKGQYEVPKPYNVSDSQHWFNKPDVCITIYKRKLDEGFYETEVHVQKIKHKTLGKVGVFKLNFDRDCERYYSYQLDKRNYLDAYYEGVSRW